jgi:hypothetical protein
MYTNKVIGCHTRDSKCSSPTLGIMTHDELSRNIMYLVLCTKYFLGERFAEINRVQTIAGSRDNAMHICHIGGRYALE